MLINETTVQEIIDQELAFQHNLGLFGDIGLFVAFVIVIVVGWLIKKYRNGFLLRDPTVKRVDGDISGQHRGGIQDGPTEQDRIGGAVGVRIG